MQQMSEGAVCPCPLVTLFVTDGLVGHRGLSGVFVTLRVIKEFKLERGFVKEIRVSVQVSQFKVNHVTNTNVRAGPSGPPGPTNASTGRQRKQKHVGRKNGLDFVVRVRDALVRLLNINNVIAFWYWVATDTNSMRPWSMLKAKLRHNLTWEPKFRCQFGVHLTLYDLDAGNLTRFDVT